MTKETKPTFAHLRAQLDELLTWFDQEDLDVDQAIANYEKAIALTKDIEAYLVSAENKITKL